jgi:flavodoxin
MNSLIVYDSAFGNTEKIAKAIGAALGATVLRVHEVRAEQLTGLDVLSVGSPTQAFQALKTVKVFLQTLPAGALHGVKVASFDTRMDVKAVNSRLLTLLVRLFGYAAAPIAAQLTKKGASLAIPPTGFIVEGKAGPLRAGEVERAVLWARQLG